MTSPPSDARDRGWLLLPGAIALAHAGALAHHTVDDAMICVRYARNAVAGHGLVYNVGEWVEGFSDPLWVALITAATAAGLDGLLVAKGVGAIASALALIVAGSTARRLGVPTPAAAILLSAVAASTGYAYHAVAGLETGAHALLLALLGAALVADRPLAAAGVSGLLMWSRPEGFLYAGLLLLRLPADGWRRTLAWLLVPAGSAATLLAVRWWLYEAWLPNTFAAKVGPPARLDTLGLTLVHLGQAWMPLMPLFLCAAGLAAARPSRAQMPWLGIVGLTLFFTLASPPDWMVGGRFFVPALPAIAVLAAIGWQQIVGARADQLRYVLWIAVLAPILAGPFDRFLLEHAVWPVYPEMRGTDHQVLAAEVASRVGPDDLVATGQIGFIGVATDARVLDLAGLTDRTLPRLLKAGDLAAYVAHVVELQPRLVVLTEPEGPHQRGLHGAQGTGLRDGLLAAGWRDAGRVPLGGWRDAILLER